ncbi:MAG: hypothetical protein AAF567_18125 [Actinomycetota bacterium]
MMQRLRATSQRVQRSAARVVPAARPAADTSGLGHMQPRAAMSNAIVWNVKPMVPATAFCTFGTYHQRRLQEMPT